MACVLFMYMFRNLKSLEIEIQRLQNELNAHDWDKSKVENLTKQIETTRTDHKKLVMHIEDFKYLSGLYWVCKNGENTPFAMFSRTNSFT